MRALNSILCGIAIAGCAASAAAQQPSSSDPTEVALDAQPAPPQQSSAAAVPVPSTAGAPEVANTQLRPVQGELEKNLDSKSAKTGDAVVVKTTEKTATADGTVIPAGSRIVGQVVDAHPAGGGNQNARVTLAFDHAELKDGRRLPVQTILQTVAPADGSSAGVNRSASSTAHTSALTSNRVTGAAASTPGPLGGSAAVPGTNRTAPNTAGSPVQEGNTAPAAGTVVSRQGDLAISTTTIPGVLVAANDDGKAEGQSAGSIVGARQNVELASGTRILLAVTDTGTMTPPPAKSSRPPSKQPKAR